MIMIKNLIQNFISKEKNLLLLGLLVITVVFSPYLYLGEDIHVPIFDNLDSNIVWAKMVLEQGAPFLAPDTIIDQMMNGVPLSSLYASYDISLIWFKLFGMFWGYVFNKYLLALIGFFGMYFLLKKHILPKDAPLYLLFGVSICYALLPFWSFSASVAGIPFVFYAFLNFRQKDTRLLNWIILFIFAFYSSLILTGVFILVIISCLWLWDAIKSRHINYQLLLGIIFLSLMYIISHLPLFNSFFFDSDFISHRTEFYDKGHGGLVLLKNALNILIFNSDDIYAMHVPTLHQYMVIAIIVAACLMIKNKDIDLKLIIIIIYILFSLCIYMLYEWRLFAEIKHTLAQIIPIDIKRFLWLYPTCWYLAWGIALFYILAKVKKSKYLILLALLIQFIFVFCKQPYFANDVLTYRSFYAEQQFNDIKQYIGKDVTSYKVINLWMPPGVAQYSGIHTLDGFSTNYSLDYKRQFRKIIKKELDKNVYLENFFDNWGSLCYAYIGEVGVSNLNYGITRTTIQHLDYNYDALKEMGGQYIISAAEINTVNNPRLKLLKVFANYPTSHWTIYLYEVL